MSDINLQLVADVVRQFTGGERVSGLKLKREDLGGICQQILARLRGAGGAEPVVSVGTEEAADGSQQLVALVGLQGGGVSVRFVLADNVTMETTDEALGRVMGPFTGRVMGPETDALVVKAVEEATGLNCDTFRTLDGVLEARVKDGAEIVTATIRGVTVTRRAA